jgi:hypothetical protein
MLMHWTAYIKTVLMSMSLVEQIIRRLLDDGQLARAVGRRI